MYLYLKWHDFTVSDTIMVSPDAISDITYKQPQNIPIRSKSRAFYIFTTILMLFLFNRKMFL